MPIDASFLVPGGAQRSPLFGRVFATTMLQAGLRVGPYRVVRELGRGGMGVVYLAERADGEFEQAVALKLVSNRGGNALEQEQLRRERQILAGLQHPGIARLLDGGTDAQGRLWFALEHVEGTRIDRYCEEHELGVTQRLRLIVDVCDAVQFAHSRLLIHQDIKPANILVTPAGATKLIDFGIARLLVVDADAQAAPGTHALTPGYASPEQLRGAAVGTASDIFQLGRLVHRLLVTDTTKTAPPSRDVDAIIARATHAHPADRYASVAELRADIEHALAHRPVQARSGGAFYRAGRFVRRHRIGVTATSLIALAFVATIALFMTRLAHERDQARAAEQHAKEEAARANRIKDFLASTFSVADPGVNRGDHLTATEILDRGAAEAEHALANEPDLEASLLGVIGEAYVGLGDFPRADPLLTRSLALHRAAGEGDTRELGHSLRALAWLRHKQSRFDDASSLLDEALVKLQGAPDAIDDLAAARDQKALAQKHLGDTAGALNSAESAVATARGGDNVMRLVATLDHLGLLYYALDRDADAGRIYAEALPLADAKLGGGDTRTIAVRENYALVLSDLGEGQRAEAMMRGAIAAEQAEYDGDNVNVIESLLLLGNLQVDIERVPDAVATYRHALDASTRSHGVGTETIASLHANLGSALAASDDVAAALDEFERAIAVYEHEHVDSQYEIAHVHAEHADALYRLGRFAPAEAELRAALAVYAVELPAEHRYRVLANAALAQILAARGAHDEALDLLRQTLPALDRVTGAKKENADAHALFARLSAQAHNA